ncbi:MAG: two-component system, chemotaxis family, sensor kinase CheA [Clostridiales bacterium]|jgi:two-component system chemotaxis sensor kinase CheA|nr:CheA signal transduction histidine kinase [Oscillospiraceae bacterium]MDN5378658.1 two-component system, chemotaxis family, sensor kinase CheA [Clostridiales bacterium]
MSKFEAGMEAMVDMYIYETTTLLEQLDQILMKTESASSFGEEDINEIFRIMHTIKGSSAMMGLENMSTLAHAIEDMFFIIREEKPVITNTRDLYELVFNASDLLKAEIELLQEDSYSPTDFSGAKQKIFDFVDILKGKAPSGGTDQSAAQPPAAAPQAAAPAEQKSSEFTAVRVFFEDDCKMENLRALLIINKIRDDCEKLEYEPADIETNPESAKKIIENGFIIRFKPNGPVENITREIEEALNVKSYEFISAPAQSAPAKEEKAPAASAPAQPQQASPAAEKKTEPAPQKEEGASVEQINNLLAQSKGSGAKQSLISVNLNKLDQLLDMVGEIVITEAMVTANPDLKGLQLDNFQKAARQLRKLTDELQDIVMSIRMVPLSGAFNKMTRIVRDMKVKLNKDVDLVFEGEETEVDKSVIDNLNDPLMHMVRNAMDHGIEDTAEERIAKGKPAKGTITLSAYNASGEVIIVVSDDGKGIDPAKVLAKAKKNGLLTKPEKDYTEKEIYNLIMLPGFSTNEVVTEYSGRGVGMDVVRKNIEKIGGSVSVDSKFGQGTNFIIKIPLSLAIVDGMEVTVGKSIFTIPINSIKESFKLKPKQLIKDTSGKEMIMIRGECYPLIRLYDIYGLEPSYTDLFSGIIILVEAEGKSACLFADELIGEQQVVVKPFSPLLNNFKVKQNGMAGCTILGDGSITIILDVNNIISNF